MHSILCVEDDIISLKSITASLGRDYNLASCSSIQEAKNILQTSTKIFSLILIDRGLPDGDGLSLCLFIKEHLQLAEIPVIFLTASASEQDKVLGFFSGAEDYITKPFGLLELKARVAARLRNQTSSLRFGNLEVEVDGQRAFIRNGGPEIELVLTKIEFKILLSLIRSKDKIQSRELLLEKVWGQGCHVGDRVIDSHVSRLRKKINEPGLAGVSIVTLRGEGYKISLALG